MPPMPARIEDNTVVVAIPPCADANADGMCDDPMPGCADDADCDDGRFCNGGEACIEFEPGFSECVSGASPCGSEQCFEDTQLCSFGRPPDPPEYPPCDPTGPRTLVEQAADSDEIETVQVDLGQVDPGSFVVVASTFLIQGWTATLDDAPVSTDEVSERIVVEIPGDVPPGEHILNIDAPDPDCDPVATATFTIE